MFENYNEIDKKYFTSLESFKNFINIARQQNSINTFIIVKRIFEDSKDTPTAISMLSYLDELNIPLYGVVANQPWNILVFMHVFRENITSGLFIEWLSKRDPLKMGSISPAHVEAQKPFDKEKPFDDFRLDNLDECGFPPIYYHLKLNQAHVLKIIPEILTNRSLIFGKLTNGRFKGLTLFHLLAKGGAYDYLEFIMSSLALAENRPTVDLDHFVPGPPLPASLAVILADAGKYWILQSLLEYNQYQVDFNVTYETGFNGDDKTIKMSLISYLIRDIQTELLEQLLRHSKIFVKLSDADRERLSDPRSMRIRILIHTHNTTTKLHIERLINAAKHGNLEVIEELSKESLSFDFSENSPEEFNFMYWLMSCDDINRRNAMLEWILDGNRMTRIDGKLTRLHIHAALGKVTDEILKSEEADSLGLRPRDIAVYLGYGISRDKTVINTYDFNEKFETGLLRGTSLLWLIAKQNRYNLYQHVRHTIKVDFVDIFQKPELIHESLISLLPYDLARVMLANKNDINGLVYDKTISASHVTMSLLHFVAIYHQGLLSMVLEDNYHLVNPNEVYRALSSEFAPTTRKSTFHHLIDAGLDGSCKKILELQPDITINLSSNFGGVTLINSLQEKNPDLLTQIQSQNKRVKGKLYQKLICAITENNVEEIDQILKNGVVNNITGEDIRAYDQEFHFEYAPINAACVFGHVEILIRLMSNDNLKMHTYMQQPNFLIDVLRCEDVVRRDAILLYFLTDKGFNQLNARVTEEHIYAAQGKCSVSKIINRSSEETSSYPAPFYLLLALISKRLGKITEDALVAAECIIQSSQKNNISIIAASLTTGNEAYYALLVTHIANNYNIGFNLNDSYLDVSSKEHLRVIQSAYYGISVAHVLAISRHYTCLSDLAKRYNYQIDLNNKIILGPFAEMTLALTLCINKQYDLLKTIIEAQSDLILEVGNICGHKLTSLLEADMPEILEIMRQRKAKKFAQEEAEKKEARAKNQQFVEARQAQLNKGSQTEQELPCKEAITKLFADYNIVAEFVDTPVKNTVLLYIHISTKEANLIAPLLKDKKPKMERNPQTHAAKRKAKHELLVFKGNETEFKSLFNSKIKAEIVAKLNTVQPQGSKQKATAMVVAKAKGEGKVEANTQMVTDVADPNNNNVGADVEDKANINANASKPVGETQKAMTQEQLLLWDEYLKTIFCRVQEMEISWQKDQKRFEVKLPIGIRWTFPNIHKGTAITLFEDFIQRDLILRVSTRLQGDSKVAKVEIDTSTTAPRTLYITPIAFDITHDKSLIDSIKLKIKDHIPKAKTDKPSQPIVKPQNESGIKPSKREVIEDELLEQQETYSGSSETQSENRDANTDINNLFNFFLILQRSAGLGETQFKNIFSNCTFKEGTRKLLLELKFTAAPIGQNLYIKPQDFFSAIQFYCDIIQGEFMKSVVKIDHHLFIFDLDKIPLDDLRELIDYFRQDVVDRIRSKSINPVPTAAFTPVVKVEEPSPFEIAEEEEKPALSTSQSTVILKKLKYAFSRFTELEKKNMTYHISALELIKSDIEQNDVVNELAYIGNVLQILLTIARKFDVPGRPSGNNIFYHLRNVIRHAYEKLDFETFYHKTSPLVDLVVFHMKAGAYSNMTLKNQSESEHLDTLKKLEALLEEHIDDIQEQKADNAQVKTEKKQQNPDDLKVKREKNSHYKQRLDNLDKVDPKSPRGKLFRDAVLTLSMFRGEYDAYNLIDKIAYIILGHHKLRKGERVDFDYEGRANELIELISQQEISLKKVR